MRTLLLTIAFFGMLYNAQGQKHLDEVLEVSFEARVSTDYSADFDKSFWLSSNKDGTYSAIMEFNGKEYFVDELKPHLLYDTDSDYESNYIFKSDGWSISLWRAYFPHVGYKEPLWKLDIRRNYGSWTEKEKTWKLKNKN